MFARVHLLYHFHQLIIIGKIVLANSKTVSENRGMFIRVTVCRRYAITHILVTERAHGYLLVLLPPQRVLIILDRLPIPHALGIFRLA
jgi:hypothetical protein